MTREIPYFNVENDFGGDQHKLDRFIMIKGGCAAVTACDCSIYFELYKNIHGLYPYDAQNISYKNYRQFSEIMTPYLHPRMGGIDKLETYIDGFKKFLVKRGVTQINFTAWHGEENISDTITKVKSTIDAGFPIPCALVFVHGLRRRRKIFRQSHDLRRIKARRTCRVVGHGI